MSAHAAAVAAVVGAWWSWGAPSIVVIVAVGLALWRRGVLTLGLAVVVVVGLRADHALGALSPPVAGPFDAWVVMVDDPRPLGAVGARVTVRSHGRLLTATAHGPTAGRLDDALAGERARLVGTVRPVSAADSAARWRHVVGRITVDEVAGRARGSPVTRWANAVRRTLGRGAEGLDRADRAVFLGMVIGDDRGQTPAVADDFRAAGLGHLLVVSGQNVAFVLAVVAPVVGRWRPAGRLLGFGVVLAGFALLTRFEPSVLRAVAMAGAGIGAATFGRPIDGRRALSWAIAGVVAVDPFLVHRVAFQLSVAATAGIVWWSAALADRLVGPRWLRVPFATTAAAQLGVAPVLLAVFGPTPLATLPANLAAGPVSGAVMIWGCTAGLVAGLTGGFTADLLHLPTRVMLWWIGGVASVASRGPQATVGVGGVLLLGGAALAAVSGRPRVRMTAAGVAGVTIAVAVATAPKLAPGPTLLGSGATVWVGDGSAVLVLDDPSSPRALLEELRRAGAGRLSLIVARDGDRADADAVIALHQRYGPVAVAAPPQHRVPGGRTVAPGQIVENGGLVVRIDEVTPRIHVTVERGPPGGDAAMASR